MWPYQPVGQHLASPRCTGMPQSRPRSPITSVFRWPSVAGPDGRQRTHSDGADGVGAGMVRMRPNRRPRLRCLAAECLLARFAACPQHLARAGRPPHPGGRRSVPRPRASDRVGRAQRRRQVDAVASARRDAHAGHRHGQRPFACAASAFNDGTPCISADRRKTQAPTLCERWNARDLLAHVLVRRWRSSQRGLAAPASSALPGRALSSVST